MHRKIASVPLRPVLCSMLGALLSAAAFAQPLQPSQVQVTASKTSSLADPHAYAAGSSAFITASKPVASSQVRPFSRVAFGGGISLLGVHLLAATNVNSHLDLRGDGRFFQYNIGNFNTNGFDISPRLNLASAGVSLDYYPFPTHGLRLTPGVLFYNHNQASSAVVAEGGSTFTLNDDNYNSSPSNPVSGTVTLNLHSRAPAFTVTTGWGSFLPAMGKHWSFPFEIGVAFIGSPKVDMALTSGQTCDDTGENCADVTSNQQLQTDLKAQAAKYEHDMDPLKTFPIIGFGVVYNFGIRSR